MTLVKQTQMERSDKNEPLHFKWLSFKICIHYNTGLSTLKYFNSFCDSKVKKMMWVWWKLSNHSQFIHT